MNPELAALVGASPGLLAILGLIFIAARLKERIDIMWAFWMDDIRSQKAAQYTRGSGFQFAHGGPTTEAIHEVALNLFYEHSRVKTGRVRALFSRFFNHTHGPAQIAEWIIKMNLPEEIRSLDPSAVGMSYSSTQAVMAEIITEFNRIHTDMQNRGR